MICTARLVICGNPGMPPIYGNSHNSRRKGQRIVVMFDLTVHFSLTFLMQRGLTMVELYSGWCFSWYLHEFFWDFVSDIWIYPLKFHNMVYRFFAQVINDCMLWELTSRMSSLRIDICHVVNNVLQGSTGKATFSTNDKDLIMTRIILIAVVVIIVSQLVVNAALLWLCRAAPEKSISWVPNSDLFS